MNKAYQRITNGKTEIFRSEVKQPSSFLHLHPEHLPVRPADPHPFLYPGRRRIAGPPARSGYRQRPAPPDTAYAGYMPPGLS